ncbi:hypothetical protein [Streptomyces sp. NBC_01618]|uniref:hypothetical protein n=1 Tax=Streptomyces sp. NBC_01618 TaxID=2975900 RepID=UPI00386A153E|nr:hypothetical protein OH735_15530 [Streptomyces sp. NBC_01618]
MARAVEFAAVLGSDKAGQALGPAAAAGRFGDEDLSSLLGHLAACKPARDLVLMNSVTQLRNF